MSILALGESKRDAKLTKNGFISQFQQVNNNQGDSPEERMEGYSNNREPDFHFIAEFFALRKWGRIRVVGSAGLAWVSC